MYAADPVLVVKVWTRREARLTDVYERLCGVVRRLDGRPPEEDLATFGELLLLRDAIFEGLALPVTAHNSLRLYDCAEAKAL